MEGFRTAAEDRTVEQRDLGRPKRVLIADSDHARRVTVANAVDRDPQLELVSSVADGRTALNQLTSGTPDVVILDSSLSAIDGTVLLGIIRSRRIAVGVLLLADVADSSAIVEALQHEPDGLLFKDSSYEEICAAVVSIVRGDVTFRAKTQMTHARLLVQRPPQLAPREREVLTLVASGLTIEEVAARLNVSMTSVKNALATVRSKFEASNNVEAAVKAMRVGLIE